MPVCPVPMAVPPVGLWAVRTSVLLCPVWRSSVGRLALWLFLCPLLAVFAACGRFVQGGAVICAPVPCLAVLWPVPVAVRHIVAGGGTRAPCWPVPVGLSSVGGLACSCSGLPVPPVGRFRGLWAVRTGRGGYLCPCALFGRPVAVILRLRLSF